MSEPAVRSVQNRERAATRVEWFGLMARETKREEPVLRGARKRGEGKAANEVALGYVKDHRSQQERSRSQQGLEGQESTP